MNTGSNSDKSKVRIKSARNVSRLRLQREIFPGHYNTKLRGIRGITRRKNKFAETEINSLPDLRRFIHKGRPSRIARVIEVIFDGIDRHAGGSSKISQINVLSIFAAPVSDSSDAQLELLELEPGVSRALPRARSLYHR